jgi:hypothetical protein
VWAIADPITESVAKDALRLAVPELDRHLAGGHIEIVQGTEWYLNKGQFDLNRLVGGWDEKLRRALARGYDGMRASGNAFWFETNHWKQFCEYEHELNRTIAGKKMIVLCTCSLQASRAVDMLDVARRHQDSITRRNGEWEFLESPELTQAKQEIRKLNGALDILSKPLPGHEFADAAATRGAGSDRAGRVQQGSGAHARHQPANRGFSPRQRDAEAGRQERRRSRTQGDRRPVDAAATLAVWMRPPIPDWYGAVHLRFGRGFHAGVKLIRRFPTPPRKIHDDVELDPARRVSKRSPCRPRGR